LGNLRVFGFKKYQNKNRLLFNQPKKSAIQNLGSS